MTGFRTLAVAALASICLLSAGAAAQAQCAKIRPSQPGEVYFMRGLANIFSLGLDAFGKEVSAAGIENCVYNHSQWQSVVNDVVERSYRGEVSYPVVIIGHSLGANIAPKMATSIGKHNIPVAYVVMLDPVESTIVGANVEEIFNYYLPKRQDTLVHAGAKFAGLLENVNVKKFGGFDHFNIDKNRALRDVMKQRILDLSTAQQQAAAAPAKSKKK